MRGEVKKYSSDVIRSKLLMVVAIVSAVIVIGVGVGYLAGGGAGNPPPAPSQGSAPPDAGTHTPTVATHPVVSVPTPALPTNPIVTTPTLVQTSSIALAPTNSTDSDTNWEDKIDGIIGSDDADTNKVKQLFALFPKLPPDGQEEAAQHLSNLVEDENYAPLGDLLKDPKLPEGVQDELLADVLNRPNALKLPVLLDVASDPNHAKRDEAKDLLELYLGEELPTTGQGSQNTPDSTPIDWNKVGPMVTNWMQQNPD